MPTYTPTTWVDEIPASTPIKYAITDDTVGPVASSATIEVVTAITSGTPLNAANLNNIESGITTAQTTANTAATNAATAQATATTAAGNASTAVTNANAAQATANAAIPKSIVTAVGDLIYATASATLAKLVKPTVTAILQMTAAGAPSWRAIKQTVQVQLCDSSTDVDTTIVGYVFIPSTMNGMNLLRAQAMVLTAGTTGATTIQVRNLTEYASSDALSTAISIASAGTVGTAGIVNASYADVSTNDKIRITVTAASTTKAKGLFVVLEYQLP